MKVLLVSNYESDRQESMLRFSAALGEGLRKAGHEVEIVRPRALAGKLKPGATGIGKWLGYVDKFLLFPRELRKQIRWADVVHICDHSNAMYVRHLRSKPHVVTSHDMLAIRSAHGEFPRNQTGWTGRILQRWILGGLRRAQRIACVSNATRLDVLRFANRDEASVEVVPNGLFFPYAPVAEVAAAAEARRKGESVDAAIFEKHGVPAKRYLLHVGGSHWYKNRRGALAIHAALRRRFGAESPLLVMVGAPLSREVPGVEVRAHAESPELAALYSGAELLLFPSLEEGFGMPSLEAQACGCRVLTTRKPPMTEVGGDAAFYLADPTDAEAGAGRLIEILAQDESTRAEAVKRGLENAARFTNERMVADYVRIYEEVLKS